MSVIQQTGKDNAAPEGARGDEAAAPHNQPNKKKTQIDTVSTEKRNVISDPPIMYK